jgi:HAMP domain-containing protein
VEWIVGAILVVGGVVLFAAGVTGNAQNFISTLTGQSSSGTPSSSTPAGNAAGSTASGAFNALSIGSAF